MFTKFDVNFQYVKDYIRELPHRYFVWKRNKMFEKGQKKKNVIISVYFGVPGAGKSTIAAYNAKKMMKYGVPVYSNVPIKGTRKLEPHEDIGVYNVYDGLVIVDECGIEYNNRNFKDFKQRENEWYKTHRHYKCQIDLFSQSYRDMDLKIRDLAVKYYIVKKCLLWPLIPLVYTRRIAKWIGVRESDSQIDDQYKFVPFSKKYYWAPGTWHLFDTHERKLLPEKEWEVW